MYTNSHLPLPEDGPKRPPLLSKRDSSIIGRWWWEIDRVSLFALLVLIILGVLLSFSASPSVAERLHLAPFYFIKRHCVGALIACVLIVLISFFSLKTIQTISFLGYIICIVGLIGTLMGGFEVKGAKRWVMISGNSLQISEFIKPFLVIVTSWCLAHPGVHTQYRGAYLSGCVLFPPIALIILQPDLGMSFVILATWITQLFIAGIPLFWMGGLACLGGGAGVGAYFLLPHVTKRVDHFLSPSSDSLSDLYQITQSLHAFTNGGLLGRGPGEGHLKNYVPDVHADFIFSVAGEEFGLIGCTGILILISLFIGRKLYGSFKYHSLFPVLCMSGLAFQFFLQSFINIASSIHLIPTKGMTLPFLSYGGSSLCALSIAVGFMMALGRIQTTPKQ